MIVQRQLRRRRGQYLNGGRSPIYRVRSEYMSHNGPKAVPHAAPDRKRQTARISAMLTGMGRCLTANCGERMRLVLMLNDPEERAMTAFGHTHNSHYYDEFGHSKRVPWCHMHAPRQLGSPAPSLSDLVAAEERRSDAECS